MNGPSPESDLRALLDAVARGERSVDDALRALRAAPTPGSFVGDRATGAGSAGDPSIGDRSIGDASTNDAPISERSIGEQSIADTSTDDPSTAAASTGNASTTDASTVDQSPGGPSTPDRSSGDPSTDDTSTIAASTGDRTTGDLGFATVDHDRARRCGFPEVVFCEGKTPAQAAAIATEILTRSDRVLLTRADRAHADAVRAAVPRARYHELARCLSVAPPVPEHRVGEVAVVSAGTADLPVADEAAVTLEAAGNRVRRYTDVGVAGLHRLLARVAEIRRANAVVVVAGMEGALPSVVAGLVDKPVVAVPTSVGYGASFQGLSALLTMLNSCAAGIGVVNIDNGFGAGYLASQINRQAAAAAPGTRP